MTSKSTVEWERVLWWWPVSRLAVAPTMPGRASGQRRRALRWRTASMRQQNISPPTDRKVSNGDPPRALDRTSLGTGKRFFAEGTPATLIRTRQHESNAVRQRPQFLQGRRAFEERVGLLVLTREETFIARVLRISSEKSEDSPRTTSLRTSTLH
jgi:hypothetical protein